MLQTAMFSAKLKILDAPLVSSTEPVTEIIDNVDSKIITLKMPSKSNYNIDIYPYMLFDGTFRAPRDLQCGEELMGEDSQPCKILDIIKKKEKAYLVTPIKGEEYIVGESDILSLTYGSNPTISFVDNLSYEFKYFNKDEKREVTKCFSVKNYETKEKALEAATNYKNELNIDVNDNYFNMSVAELLSRPKHFQVDCKSYKIGLNFPHTNFKISPYVVGLWIGDGSSGASHITSADTEIVEYLKEYFEDFKLIVKSNGIHHGISSGKKGNNYKGKNPFMEFLREKEMYQDKHIPMELLLTSRENRLALLAGLLDSDGSLHNNCYDFIQKREYVFDKFIFLCRSLGFSCYKSPCVKFCYNSPGGPKPGEYFRCTVSGEGLEEIPTLLNRKQAHERKQVKRAYVNGFTMKEIGEMEIYKIVTDTPKFLMADFTVRHRHEIIETIISKPKKTKNLFPYGYKKQVLTSGDIAVIHEEEAKIVQYIFQESIQKVKCKEIAKKLNSKNIQTRFNDEWDDGSIIRIIHHKDKYLGGLMDDKKSNWPIILDKTFENCGKLLKQKMSYPFGYKKGKDGPEIVEERAEIIKFIYEEYYQGSIVRIIADKLNSQGIKTITGINWNESSVRNLLKNRNTYLGKKMLPCILDEKYENHTK
jgi:hypothetical protein